MNWKPSLRADPLASAESSILAKWAIHWPEHTNWSLSPSRSLLSSPLSLPLALFVPFIWAPSKNKTDMETMLSVLTQGGWGLGVLHKSTGPITATVTQRLSWGEVNEMMKFPCVCLYCAIIVLFVFLICYLPVQHILPQFLPPSASLYNWAEAIIRAYCVIWSWICFQCCDSSLSISHRAV